VSPKKEHGETIKWLGRYLKGTCNKGLILKPDGVSGLEVYVNANLVGNWDPQDTLSQDSPRSRHRYKVKFNNCPILWKLQMATEIALSSTESEYTGASATLCEAIPVMELLKEMKSLLVIAKQRSIVSFMKTIVELCKYFGTRSTGPERNTYWSSCTILRIMLQEAR
jgi:hypothetical protein